MCCVEDPMNRFLKIVSGMLIGAFISSFLTVGVALAGEREEKPAPEETSLGVRSNIITAGDPSDPTTAAGSTSMSVTYTNSDGSQTIHATYMFQNSDGSYAFKNVVSTISYGETQSQQREQQFSEANPPVCHSFIAAPPQIVQGNNSNLTWSTSNATSVSISPGVGPVGGSGNTSVSPSSTNTYTLTASNSDGSCSLQTTVTVLGRPGVTKSACPAATTLGDTFSFTLSYGNASSATITDTLPGSWNFIGASPNPSSIAGRTLTWSGLSGSGAIAVTVQTVASGTATNAATITNPGVPPVSSSCTVSTQAGVTLRGDVTAVSRIARVTVSGPSVVTSGTTINITTSGTVFQLQGYLQALKSQWRQMIDKNVSRLLSERARSYGSNTLSSGNVNPNGRIDGEVWRVNGDFRIPSGGVTVSGRATFIIENGSLIFDGSLNYATAGTIVGFIVRNGNVTIGSGAGAVSGAVYAPNGTVSIVGGTVSSLSVTGALIGNAFSFGDRNVSIVYDQKISLTPPPGFINLQAPIFQEVAP